MRHSVKTSIDILPIERLPSKYPAVSPSHLFTSQDMPIIDVHFHLPIPPTSRSEAKRTIDRYLKIMDEAKIHSSISLSGTSETITDIEFLYAYSDERIFHCPATFFSRETNEFWWDLKTIETFKRPGIPGLKQWFRYKRILNENNICQYFNKQEEMAIPSIGMHVGDPPFKPFWDPNYWPCIADAELLIRNHPSITFIIAHGFWLMCTDEGLDVLDEYFKTYPNLHVDLSAVFQWWNQPTITYEKLRNFIIRHEDRILFGTDGNVNYTNKTRINCVREILETDNENLGAFFGDENGNNCIKGLCLPLETLNKIYWANALRLLPGLNIKL